jgi:TonB family protein
MFPQPMSWSEPREHDSQPLAQPDLAEALEQQIANGFPPGLALDLVLNELVVRAATATRASAAALALRRGDEMVCRAATGEHAPDLGIPLNTRDGLSGACLRTHLSQLCLDTETDARVDAAMARRLGIRSMLIVPVLDGAELAGVLEVFATDPGEFMDSDQNLLEIFARDAARIRRVGLELEQRPALVSNPAYQQPVLGMKPAIEAPRKSYEIWSLALGGLAIMLAVAISFMIGSRIGWLGLSDTPGEKPAAPVAAQSPVVLPPAGNKSATHSAPPAKAPADANSGGLIVYEQGKVVFRMNPAASGKSAAAAENLEQPAPGTIVRVWLAPELAETRLRQRSEPQYPADALAAHRSGVVVLEIVVGVDGSVASTRTVTGDPILAVAAADAVRLWHYEPYSVKGQPAEFQTDVTLMFSLPQ